MQQLQRLDTQCIVIAVFQPIYWPLPRCIVGMLMCSEGPVTSTGLSQRADTWRLCGIPQVICLLQRLDSRTMHKREDGIRCLLAALGSSYEGAGITTLEALTGKQFGPIVL